MGNKEKLVELIQECHENKNSGFIMSVSGLETKIFMRNSLPIIPVSGLLIWKKENEILINGMYENVELKPKGNSAEQQLKEHIIGIDGKKKNPKLYIENLSNTSMETHAFNSKTPSKAGESILIFWETSNTTCVVFSGGDFCEYYNQVTVIISSDNSTRKFLKSLITPYLYMGVEPIYKENPSLVRGHEDGKER